MSTRHHVNKEMNQIYETQRKHAGKYNKAHGLLTGSR